MTGQTPPPIGLKPETRWMSIQQAADYWSVSKDWIEKQIGERGMTVRRSGRLIRLDRDEVENLMPEVA